MDVLCVVADVLCVVADVLCVVEMDEIDAEGAMETDEIDVGDGVETEEVNAQGVTTSQHSPQSNSEKRNIHDPGQWFASSTSTTHTTHLDASLLASGVKISCSGDRVEIAKCC